MEKKVAEIYIGKWWWKRVVLIYIDWEKHSWSYQLVPPLATNSNK